MSLTWSPQRVVAQIQKRSHIQYRPQYLGVFYPGDLKGCPSAGCESECAHRPYAKLVLCALPRTILPHYGL